MLIGWNFWKSFVAPCEIGFDTKFGLKWEYVNYCVFCLFGSLFVYQSNNLLNGLCHIFVCWRIQVFRIGMNHMNLTRIHQGGNGEIMKKNEKNTKFDEENAKSSNIFYTNGELEYIIICERWMRVKANLSK